MKIVVIAGTGLIGSKVVGLLRAKGHDVLAASPNTGVNTITREGLAEALAGAGVVIDVANSPSLLHPASRRGHCRRISPTRRRCPRAFTG